MTRLGIVSNTNGRVYWVYKQIPADERRQTDYSTEKNAALSTSARKYDRTFFARMALERYILPCSVDNERFILVAENIPLKGAKEGFHRIIQSKYHVKFASHKEIIRSAALHSLIETVGTLYTGPLGADNGTASKAQAKEQAPPQVRISAPADEQSAEALVDSFMTFAPSKSRPVAQPAAQTTTPPAAAQSLQLTPVPVSSLV